jgi:3-oxoacyl-[acyl-carrier-protein] synthase II
MTRRVVVTGLGTVSPVGNSVESSWSAITQGISGVSEITAFDASSFSTRFAGQVKNFDPKSAIAAKDVKRLDKFIHYGIAASDEAIADSGIVNAAIDPVRIGVLIGSGIGGLDSIDNSSNTLAKKGYKRISPFFVPGSIINMVSGNLATKYGFQGANLAIATACASASHSIGIASRLIVAGDADVMVTGGAEAPVCPLSLGGFIAARTLSKCNDNPVGASKPWDKDRDGFVLGEGSGILVLEEYEHAKKRGAHIYAELSGFAATADAYHMTSPHPDAVSTRKAIEISVNNAHLNLTDVDYVNAHGTSTLVGDIAENLAIKNAFGEHAYKLMVSSTKSMTGHLLGGAGGIEAIYSILAIRDNIAPPTINLENPEDGCDLNYVAGSAQENTINVAISNSFGFGGTNACLVFNALN